MSGLVVSVDLPGRLRARLSATAGQRVALIGPNGAGKTTLLRAVAGTAPGEVRWGDDDWTRRPPQERSVGLVHQDHQLFPHLSALENVAFGPRARGTSRRQAKELALHWLDRLGIGGYAGRKPAGLSGGQAQRVAIARALATDPDVVLLDEPFAALDVAASMDLRDLLVQRLRDHRGVVLMTTHEALDVTALADRVVVLDEGTVAQDATPARVAEAPATAHAARLLGLNVLRGHGGPDGSVAITGGGTLFSTARRAGPVLASFPPSAVTLTRERPTGSARNAWRARVLGVVEGTGERAGIARVHLHGEHELRADVTASSVAALGLREGTEVWASVKATEVAVFPVPLTGSLTGTAR